jgi:hypothetical protein
MNFDFFYYCSGTPRVGGVAVCFWGFFVFDFSRLPRVGGVAV